ncbi:MAG: NupC/NupG family nucleoside CNT transporter [Phycisphaerae bacterium]
MIADMTITAAHVFRGVGGILGLIGIAWLLSSNRRGFPIRTVVGGLILQWVLALAVLHTNVGQGAMTGLAHAVQTILLATGEGSRFIFGNLIDDTGAWGYIFLVQVIPPIIVFSAISAIGYHLGILQWVVGLLAKVMVRLLGVSGAEGLASAGNIFVGQTEAPLFVRPYISRMTQSELMAMMVCGFATVASGPLAAYIAIVAGEDPARRVEVARHFLTACLMSAPAAFVIAKVMLPESETPETGGDAKVEVKTESRNVIHAAAIGTTDGVMLAINVVAMLIVFIALITLVDYSLVWLGGFQFMQPVLDMIGTDKLNLAAILGVVFYPIAFLIGIEAPDRATFGSLLGVAMSTNEFLAYKQLRGMIDAELISERTVRIATYCLCGFANFSSIAIQIGGIGVLAPDRKADLARLGPRAMLGGAMACWMTGTIAGVLT